MRPKLSAALLLLLAPQAECGVLRQPLLAQRGELGATAAAELTAALRPRMLRLRGGQEAAASADEEDEAADASGGSGRAPPKPSLLSRVLGSAPVTFFRSAPPITRSWVSISVLLTILASQRVVDLRTIAFSEREVLRRGQWWRLLLNFFYMGEQPLSIFYWLQIYHLWECMRILELVKFAWEPGAFVRMILLNVTYLLVLKQMAPSLMFLGTPLVMVSRKKRNAPSSRPSAVLSPCPRLRAHLPDSNPYGRGRLAHGRPLPSARRARRAA